MNHESEYFIFDPKSYRNRPPIYPVIPKDKYTIPVFGLIIITRNIIEDYPGVTWTKHFVGAFYTFDEIRDYLYTRLQKRRDIIRWGVELLPDFKGGYPENVSPAMKLFIHWSYNRVYCS